MAEYIHRETAIAKLTALEVTDPNATIADAKRVLVDMQTAEGAPVAHGRWVPFHSDAAGIPSIAPLARLGLMQKWNIARTVVQRWTLVNPGR